MEVSNFSVRFDILLNELWWMFLSPKQGKDRKVRHSRDLVPARVR